MKKENKISKLVDEMEKEGLEYLVLTVNPGVKADEIEAFFSVKSNQSKSSIKQALLRILDNIEADNWE
jgi:hypothetical protein